MDFCHSSVPSSEILISHKSEPPKLFSFLSPPFSEKEFPAIKKPPSIVEIAAERKSCPYPPKDFCQRVSPCWLSFTR